VKLQLVQLFHSVRLEFKIVFDNISGDGDSSVTKKLNEVLPYGSDFKIQKIECKNHLMRNYCTKLSALTKRTEYSIVIRKFITQNIMRFRSDITKAIEHHKNTNVPLRVKIDGQCFFS